MNYNHLEWVGGTEVVLRWHQSFLVLTTRGLAVSLSVQSKLHYFFKLRAFKEVNTTGKIIIVQTFTMTLYYVLMRYYLSLTSFNVLYFIIILIEL